MKPNVPLFHKPAWDRTKDPTIDPTLLDPNTGLPVGGKTIESLSKKHLLTADEWQEALVATGLAPVAAVPSHPVPEPVKPEPEPGAPGDEAPEAPAHVISVPVGVTADEVAAAKKAATAARIAKMQATKAANKAKKGK